MKLLLSLFVFLVHSSISAEITSIRSIKEIPFFPNHEGNVLVVFDIDDTLTILSDPAFQRPNFKIHHADTFKEIMEPLDAEEKLIAFTLPLLTSSAHLIEESCPELIKELQEKGLKTIALTAAMGGSIDGCSIEDRRIAELHRVGIDFSSSFPDILDTVFIDFAPPIAGNYPLFKKGMLLTNDNNKGEVLVKFLNILAWQPDLIIFIDDRAEHLLAVEKALEIFYPQVTFQGFRYTIDETFYGTTDVEKFSNQWTACAEKAKEIAAQGKQKDQTQHLLKRSSLN